VESFLDKKTEAFILYSCWDACSREDQDFLDKTGQKFLVQSYREVEGFTDINAYLITNIQSGKNKTLKLSNTDNIKPSRQNPILNIYRKIRNLFGVGQI
jgi:hypothetical protein